MTAEAGHPAQYSEEVLDMLEVLLDKHEVVGTPRRPAVVLDPFGGKGQRIKRLEAPGRLVVSNDIEPEWARCSTVPGLQANALQLPVRSESVHAVVSSVVYPNRMTDHHDARERCKPCNGSGYDFLGGRCSKCTGLGRREYKRLTYTHQLGRRLHPDNAGAMPWGPKYRALHRHFMDEARRVLVSARRRRLPPLFFLNVSDHYANGVLVDVTGWYRKLFEVCEFELVSEHPVYTRRMGFGANGDMRADCEWVFVWRKTA